MTHEELTTALSKKGELTILEHTAGKPIIALKADGGSVLTLRGGRIDELLTELLHICRNWPDKE
jgi:hypothetical protein